MKLSKRVIIKIIWRFFFVQGAWNFRGMQNIGFVYAMLPGLKKVRPADAEKAAKKYLRFFNTHPYMAPAIGGVFLNIEERGDEAVVEKLRPGISGSLAALGDTFFWATLKPIIALLLLLALMGDNLWAMVLVLLLYNGIHLWAMTWGFARGYRNGPSGALELAGVLSIDRTKRIALAIPLLAGMVIAVLSLRHDTGLTLLGTNLLVFIAAAVAFRLKLGVLWIFYGVFILSLVWTIIK
ncbi:MAG: PTS system mannose/fructose/sorbose family transporter subunit IID [Desulfomonilia bacterium]